MSALVLDKEAEAKVKAVVDFATKKENWYVLGSSPVPGDRTEYCCQLHSYRCVFTLTLINSKPHRHLSISTKSNLPHPIVSFTIAKMFGFTGAKEQNGAAIAPGKDWILGPHGKDRCVVLVQPVEGEA